MNLVAKFSALMLALALSPAVHAGAVEDIQTAVKDQCKKEITSADALKLVKAVMKSCADSDKIFRRSRC